jgi:hypothetical protein
MEILIPVNDIQTAKNISFAFFMITKPLTSHEFGYLFPVWKNRQGDCYLLIETDKVLTIDPDRKTTDLVSAYGDLVTAGKLPFASAQLISSYDSPMPVSHTVGELIPNELLTAFKLPKDMFATSYRPTIINQDLTPPPIVISEMEYVINKIKTGNEILGYAIALVSVKNNELNKSMADVQAILGAFSQLQQLLQVGALGTARIVVSGMSPAYPDYADAFTFLVTKITEFETVTGVLLD